MTVLACFRFFERSTANSGVSGVRVVTPTRSRAGSAEAHRHQCRHLIRNLRANKAANGLQRPGADAQRAYVAWQNPRTIKNFYEFQIHPGSSEPVL